MFILPGMKEEKQESEEKKITKEYANFRRFSARGGAEQRPKMCGVPTPQTNPTNYNKWLHVHTLVE